MWLFGLVWLTGQLLYGIVVVTCGFLVAFAVASHLLVPGVLDAFKEPAIAPAPSPPAPETVEADVARITQLPPEAHLPPTVLIRRRWNVPGAVSRELGALFAFPRSFSASLSQALHARCSFEHALRVPASFLTSNCHDDIVRC